MTNGKRDENFVPVWLGVSSVDGVTPVPVTIDPDTGRLRVYVAGFSGNPTPSSRAKRDANRVTVKIGEDNLEIAALSSDPTNKGILMKG